MHGIVFWDWQCLAASFNLLTATSLNNVYFFASGFCFLSPTTTFVFQSHGFDFFVLSAFFWHTPKSCTPFTRRMLNNSHFTRNNNHRCMWMKWWCCRMGSTILLLLLSSSADIKQIEWKYKKHISRVWLVMLSCVPNNDAGLCVIWIIMIITVDDINFLHCWMAKWSVHRAIQN